jgi:hypothetical protein
MVKRILQIFYRFKKKLKERLWYFTKGLAIRMTLYEGKLVGRDLSFRCLMIGPTLFPAEFRQKIFTEVPRVILVTYVPFFSLRRYLSSHQQKYDLCIAVMPLHRSYLLRGVAGLTGGGHVTQKISTAGGWDEVRKNMSRAKRSWLNGFQKKPVFELRVSTALADVKYFYENMFVPYTMKRYGKYAVIDSYEEILSMIAQQGMLMLMLREGQPVAASLCQRKGDELDYKRVGILDGNEEVLAVGGLMAIYYYMIDYAIAHNFQSVGLGQSRSFLTDGVFNNKARWGARAIPNIYGYHSVHYIFHGFSPQLAGAFEVCPIIVNDGSGLQAVIGHTDQLRLSSEQLQRIVRGHYLNGIRRVTVMCSQESYVVSCA